MTTFTRYYDDTIKEWIDTPELHNLVVQIRGMSLEELGEYKDNLTTEVTIDPAFERTKKFKVAAKTVIRSIQAARNRGETLTVRTGHAGIFSFIEAAIHGVIVGDEFVKRIKG